MKTWLLMVLALPAAVAAADHADLPPRVQVERALHEHPIVRAAEAGVRAEEANRSRLEAGPHEYALKLSGQQRRDRPLDITYREHEVGVERAIRLPGKATIDAELGAAGVEQARVAFGDALHESSRLLLKIWFDWQREVAAIQDWRVQVAILQRQREVIVKRVGAGDAARLEALLAEAQLAQAQAQLAQAEARGADAASALSQDFPAVRLPEVIDATTPRPVAESDEQWRARIVEHNHELRVAVLATRRGRLTAQRLDADRLADPTVGLRMASERGGQEHIIGLQLTIPLGGTVRLASARAAAADADAVAAREARVRARVEAEAKRTVAAARSTHVQWQRLTDVAQRMANNANLLEKAWRLGEGQFGDLQTARRQAIEARLAESQARLDANEAHYRLLLDAHALWSLDDDADHEH
ncbi:MAG: TolC family protein [Rhodocyclaceae bacterium]|nr:TolC family protein [Rhodocyclaceae bacterium]